MIGILRVTVGRPGRITDCVCFPCICHPDLEY
jgi:hypothetical protein